MVIPYKIGIAIIILAAVGFFLLLGYTSSQNMEIVDPTDVNPIEGRASD